MPTWARGRSVGSCSPTRKATSSACCGRWPPTRSRTGRGDRAATPADGSQTAAAAVLRYRLYDLDRIISRTLAYGLLTVLLGGGYAGAVLALGQLFGVGEGTPSGAVAGVTLAAAALFQPARRRIQQAVDRRFNRRRYHAAQTIQAFSTRLREQIDLDTLSAELLAVVDQTVEPTRVSFWLRPSPDGSSGAARDTSATDH